MSTSTTEKADGQLWGIYYTDREYARLWGDPLRTVIEDPSKSAAEEAAGKLVFESPWAHPVTTEQIPQAFWIAPLTPKRRQKPARKSWRGIHI
ncbi:MAG: hypothetical protein L0Y58_18265 [Verrucomicrobia subdivision 3 bacterium]|nr:hypothetical protein [Limisphaerales bacterium]